MTVINNSAPVVAVMLPVVSWLNRTLAICNPAGSLSERGRVLEFLLSCVFLIAFSASSCASDNQLTPQEKREGWLLLFDGEHLDNWMCSDGQPSRKPPEEGSINPHGAGHYMLVHTQKWSNFVLS